MHTQTVRCKSTRPIFVLPLASLRHGSYTYKLYDLLQKNYNVEIISFSVFSISRLFSMLSKKPIVHVHWIEHKYTLGMVNTLGRFSKLMILITIPTFLWLLLTLKSVIGCRIVTTLHNVLPHRILLPNLEKCVFRIVLQMSNVVFVHTENTKLQAKHLYGISDTKFRIIRHGNWMHIKRKSYGRKRARRILGIDYDAFVMCFIGRISADKGLHLLIEAILQIKTDLSVFLIVAGHPSDRNYFNTLVKKSRYLPPSIKILFYPRWIPDSYITLFLDACDVGVVPYVRTTTPSSVLLFMSFAKLVIAPALPEVKEFLGNSDFLLYDKSHDLSATIEKAIEVRGKLQKMGKKALRRASLFDWEKAAQTTYQSYLELQQI